MNKRWKHVRLSITALFVLAPAIVLMAHDAGGAQSQSGGSAGGRQANRRGRRKGDPLGDESSRP